MFTFYNFLSVTGRSCVVVEHDTVLMREN